MEGAAFLSARTGAPIVPVGIGGSDLAMPKGSSVPKPLRIQVVIGPAIAPPPRTVAGACPLGGARRDRGAGAAAAGRLRRGGERTVGIEALRWPGPVAPAASGRGSTPLVRALRDPGQEGPVVGESGSTARRRVRWSNSAARRKAARRSSSSLRTCMEGFSGSRLPAPSRVATVESHGYRCPRVETVECGCCHSSPRADRRGCRPPRART